MGKPADSKEKNIPTYFRGVNPATMEDCTIKIGALEIGQAKPTYIIAEMSANHNQSLQRAIDIIHAAKEAGADAVKLQTYTPDTMTIANHGSRSQEVRSGTGKTSTTCTGRRLLPGNGSLN